MKAESGLYLSLTEEQYKPLSAFTYAELDTGEYLELDPCLTCQPPRRKSLIAKENFERGAITQEEFEQALTPYEYPAPDAQQYYNPKGGKYYHGDANCPSVKDRFLPLTGFDYIDLDTGDFADLTPCPKCETLPRLDEIDKANLKQGISEDRVAEMRDEYGTEIVHAVPTMTLSADDAEEPTDHEVEVSIVIE